MSQRVNLFGYSFGAAHQFAGGEVFIEGQVHKTVLIRRAFDQQAGVMSHTPQEIIGRRDDLGMIRRAFAKSLKSAEPMECGGSAPLW